MCKCRSAINGTSEEQKNIVRIRTLHTLYMAVLIGEILMLHIPFDVMDRFLS